jgi:hypothetical protein
MLCCQQGKSTKPEKQARPGLQKTILAPAQHEPVKAQLGAGVASLITDTAESHVSENNNTHEVLINLFFSDDLHAVLNSEVAQYMASHQIESSDVDSNSNRMQFITCAGEDFSFEQLREQYPGFADGLQGLPATWFPATCKLSFQVKKVDQTSRLFGDSQSTIDNKIQILEQSGSYPVPVENACYSSMQVGYAQETDEGIIGQTRDDFAKASPSDVGGDCCKDGYREGVAFNPTVEFVSAISSTPSSLAQEAPRDIAIKNDKASVARDCWKDGCTELASATSTNQRIVASVSSSRTKEAPRVQPVVKKEKGTCC